MYTIAVNDYVGYLVQIRAVQISYLRSGLRFRSPTCGADFVSMLLHMVVLWLSIWAMTHTHIIDSVAYIEFQR